jgi:hypothetical protein
VTWDDEGWWHDWAEPLERRKDRPRCGAKTRAGGSCLVRVELGKARCYFHGGLSKRPKTEAGRRRIADAQRRQALARSLQMARWRQAGPCADRVRDPRQTA